MDAESFGWPSSPDLLTSLRPVPNESVIVDQPQGQAVVLRDQQDVARGTSPLGPAVFPGNRSDLAKQISARLTKIRWLVEGTALEIR